MYIGQIWMSIGYNWNSIWQAMMACIRAAYRTVLFLYSVTDEKLCVNVAISETLKSHFI